MFDEGPWFRRWFGFSYWPIAWQGWATVAVYLLSAAALVMLTGRVDSGTATWWIIGIIFFAIFLAFWAVAEWKVERSYGPDHD